MANSEHLSILKQGVQVWNQWREECLDTPDLQNADLHEIVLMGVNMKDANLKGANLSYANLMRADFTWADLTQADLTWANLTATNFNDANLEGANLTTATCRSTVFANVDFRRVKGLETINHYGPSSIDITTFFDSRGEIPEAFLRGTGVPEDLVQHLSSFHLAPIQFYSCFISYSHADRTFARRLHDTLQGRGIRCWLDEKQLLPGDQIHRAIDDAVRLCDKVLLCCSRASLTSWWVDKEIQNALIKEEQLWKDRGKQVLVIIPLNLDGYVLDPSWLDWKKQHLTTRLAADFRGWETNNDKFEAHFEQVVKALRAGEREKPPKPKL